MSAPQNATVNWWELQVDDITKADAFYGAVFGWSFQYPMGDQYALVISPDGQMIGGIDATSGLPLAGEGRQPRLYVHVDDLEQTLAKVRDNGGEVRHERQLISEEFGYWADFADPSGLVVGLTTVNPPS